MQEKVSAPRRRLSGFEMFSHQLVHPSALVHRYLTADAFYSGSDATAAATACLHLQQTLFFPSIPLGKERVTPDIQSKQKRCLRAKFGTDGKYFGRNLVFAK